MPSTDKPARALPNLPAKPVPMIVPPDLRRQCPSLRVLRIGELVMMTHTEAAGARAGTHGMSVSHKTRYPTIKELMICRAHFLPADRMYAILFPPLGMDQEIVPNQIHLAEVTPEEQTRVSERLISDETITEILQSNEA